MRGPPNLLAPLGLQERSCGDEAFAFVHLTWRAEERLPVADISTAPFVRGLELVMDQHDADARTADLDYD